MAATVPTVIPLVFVTLLQIGITQSLSAELSNNTDYICSLKLDFKRQINDVERKLTEVFSKTIKELKSVIKQRTECPKGWERYRQSCYMLNTQNLTWSVAEESCRYLSAYLVEIDSRGENDFIQKMLKENANRFHTSDRQRAWLGGTDTTNESMWIWNFSGSPLRFKRWRKGDPNNGGGKENCMEMWVKEGEWNDAFCSGSFASVCEKDLWV